MTAEKFSNILGNINDKYIEESVLYSPRKRNVLRFAALAACICFFVLGIWRFSIAFVGNEATDHYRDGHRVDISDMKSLDHIYNGELLTSKLEGMNAELYISQKCGGDGELTYDINDTESWYSLIISSGYENSKLSVFCFFNGNVEDWKVDMVFTKNATEKLEINGVPVQVARRELSLGYEYAYYAIFEYGGVVYDVRTCSDDKDFIYLILDKLLMEEQS